MGVSVQGGISVERPPRIRKAGDTHPTGMLSCLFDAITFLPKLKLCLRIRVIFHKTYRRLYCKSQVNVLF